MPLYMIREDITRMNVDAIVDPTDRWYSGSGGSDLAIHTAAGPELEAELARHTYPKERVSISTTVAAR